MAACVPAKWWLLLGAAVAVIAIVLLASGLSRKHAQGPNDGSACSVPASVSVHPLPDADSPPAILWADGNVRLFLNGEPTYSSPDEPRRLRTGDYEIRADAPHAQRVVTRMTVAPFEPVLVEASFDDVLGLSVLRLGAACKSCDFAESPVVLTPERSSTPTSRLLSEAAAALRHDDWFTGASRLRQVPQSERGKPPFLRLAAIVYADTLQPQLAERTLALLPPGSPLPRLVQTHRRLQAAERERKQSVVLDRWNKVTERFAALIGRFEKAAPAPVASAAKRLEKLSGAFEAASRTKDVPSEQETLAAAESALAALGSEIRATRPDDCAFQADVVATLVR